MNSCNNCMFRSISLTGNKIWKCKQFGNIKRFNHPLLHGWFCKYFRIDIGNETVEGDEGVNPNTAAHGDYDFNILAGDVIEK